MPEKEDIAHQEAMDRLFRSVRYLSQITGRGWQGEVHLTGISVRIPEHDEMETLVVLRGYIHNEGMVVAFHSDVGALEALAGALRRMKAGKLKWKEDTYAHK